MSARDIAWEQIDAARRYSLGLLEGVSERDWFQQPSEGVTHVGWQVGHLATSQYSLGLVRLRGEMPDDTRLVPLTFREHFIRGSTPTSDTQKYPSPAQIIEVLSRVHAAVREEVAKHTDADLEQPQLGKPHPLFNTKIGGLFWCARHEMLHAGQIGLLKRLLGHSAKW
jgi:hypothetical protein